MRISAQLIWSSSLALALTMTVAGCGGGGDSTPVDASVTADGATGDGSTDDGATGDGSTVDGTTVDGTTVDGTTVDGTTVDGATVDGTTVDGSTVDARPVDAAPVDAVVTSCSGQPDGTLCPGGDVNGAERCYANACVGTYVTPAPVGNDSNAGTRMAPKATIAAALVNAAHLNNAAPLILGCARGQTLASFSEDLSVPAGLSVKGRFVRETNGTWARDPICTTEIRPTSLLGVRYSDPNTTNTTLLLDVNVVGAMNPQGEAVGITISENAAPRLEKVTVTGGLSPMGVSAAIAIVRGVGPGTKRPSLVDVTATGAAGEVSTALIAVDVGVDILRGQYTGGTGSITSRAISCEDCAPLTISGGTSISGTNGGIAEGISIEGLTSGTTITDAVVVGGASGNDIMGDIRNGIRFYGCTGTPAQITGGSIAGLVGGTVLESRGVSINDCDVTISDVSSIVGATTAGATDLHVDSAIGVECLGQSECRLLQNGIIAGTRAGLAGGKVIADGHATGVVLEAAGEILGEAGTLQQITGGDGVSVSAVNISNSVALANPVVIGFNLLRAGTCTSSGGASSSIANIFGNPRFENNVMLGGGCANYNVGILFNTGPQSVGAAFVNNHIEVTGHASLNSATHGVNVTTGATAPPPSGVFLNNTILVTTGNDRSAIYEDSTVTDLARLANNNIYTAGAPLYRDEGTTDYTNLAQVNALPGAGLGPIASGNISANPLVDSTYHLQMNSPNINAGALMAGAVTAPTVDMDGTTRGAMVDIGPDER